MESTKRSGRGGDKRERILVAAVKIFARYGFYNAKISQVAKEAGVADGTIYLYFKNKDDLLISAFEDVMTLLNNRVQGELRALKSPTAKLQRCFQLHLGLAIERPDLAEFVTVELRQSAKFIKEYSNPQFGEYLAMVSEIIADGQACGEFRNDVEARASARAIFGALDECLLAIVLGHKDTHADIERQCVLLEKLFISGLTANN